MKIKLLAVGKTDLDYIKAGFQFYEKKLAHYTTFEFAEIQDVKAVKNTSDLIEAEGEKIIRHLNNDDFVILLDEHGKQLTSRAFAKTIEQKMVQGIKNVVFIIGGAYGVNDAVKQRANTTLALSKMTFPHQLIRLIFAEQLYRAMTILRNEPYHHD